VRRAVLSAIDFAALNGQIPSRPLDESQAETVRDIRPQG
jgi:hypothetical protein